jgi:hypothetical protein
VKSRFLYVLWISVTLILGAASACAQSTGAASTSPAEGSPMGMEEMRTRLALTPEQEAQIAPLVEERNAKLKALRESGDSSGSRREKLGSLKQARGIQQDFVKQVEPLLSKEQRKEWKVLREEMKETAKERLREKRGG